MNAGRNTCKTHSVWPILCLLAVFTGMVTDPAWARRRSDRSRGSFDALGFPGDDRVITADVGIAPRESVRVAVVDTLRSKSTAEPADKWQVQFFATTDLAEAEDVQKRAEETLKLPVTLLFETPYYKLRVGRLPTHDAAESLAVKLRARGYESAWVVPIQPLSKSTKP